MATAPERPEETVMPAPLSADEAVATAPERPEDAAARPEEPPAVTWEMTELTSAGMETPGMEI